MKLRSRHALLGATGAALAFAALVAWQDRQTGTGATPPAEVAGAVAPPPTGATVGDGSAGDAGAAGRSASLRPATASSARVESSRTTAPLLDLVRVEASGSALVAGRGPPSSDIVVRLDGAGIAATRTDGSGNFVSMFDIDAMDAPRMLTVEAVGPDGRARPAEGGVIVAPAHPVAGAPGRPPASVAVADGVEAGAAGARRRPPALALAPTGASAADLRREPAGARRVASATPDRARGPGSADVAQAARPARPSEANRPAKPSAEGAVPAARGGVDMPVVSALSDGGPTTRAAVPGPRKPQPGPAGITTAAPRDPPMLFRAGPDGVTALSNASSARPDVAEDLGIDAISYGTAGDVRLSGRARAGSELRVYIDGEAVETLRVEASGTWSTPLPDVRSGVYTLRIDAVNADGSLAQRVETPFQLTAPEVAARARADGARAITVQPGYTLWAISEGYFGSGVQYVQIFDANRALIRNPDLIYPGQIFALPDAAGAGTHDAAALPIPDRAP